MVCGAAFTSSPSELAALLIGSGSTSDTVMLHLSNIVVSDLSYFWKDRFVWTYH